MVLNLDLNFPPCEESSASAESRKGLFSCPIDVEELDDEVELLLSPAEFPQSKRPRRNPQMTVDLEQQVNAIPPAISGVSITEPAAILLSLSSQNNYGRTSTNRNDTVTPLFFELEELQCKNSGATSSQNEAGRMPPELLQPPTPPPELLQPPPPPKEPIFTCPLCMDSFKTPCSTFCGHIFCQGCIEAAIAACVKKKSGKQCPTCRAKLPPKKSFHRVYLPLAD